MKKVFKNKAWLPVKEKVVAAEEDISTGIELKVQSLGKRPQSITLKSGERFEVLMSSYASKMGTEVGKIRFQFDGELLNPFDTPQDLDLEGGECIDAHLPEDEPVAAPPPTNSEVVVDNASTVAAAAAVMAGNMGNAIVRQMAAIMGMGINSSRGNPPPRGRGRTRAQYRKRN